MASTLPLGNPGSVFAATIYQGNLDRQRQIVIFFKLYASFHSMHLL
jgi:hypothetical protein